MESRPGRIKDAAIGDPCLAYVTGECVFAGFGEITSPYYYDDESETSFPHRLDIDIKLFDRTVDIRPLISALDFIRDKRYWMLSLQGGAIKIPLSDFELIRAKLEER